MATQCPVEWEHAFFQVKVEGTPEASVFLPEAEASLFVGCDRYGVDGLPTIRCSSSVPSDSKSKARE